MASLLFLGGRFNQLTPRVQAIVGALAAQIAAGATIRAALEYANGIRRAKLFTRSAFLIFAKAPWRKAGLGSTSLQTVEDHAGFEQACFVIRCKSGGTRDFKCRLDLPKSCLGHRCVFFAIRKLHHRDALIADARGPIEREALARPFLQRLAIGRDRLLEPLRPVLALPVC